MDNTEAQYDFANRNSGSFKQVKDKVERLLKSKQPSEYIEKVLGDMIEYHSKATYNDSQDSVEYLLVVLEDIKYG